MSRGKVKRVLLGGIFHETHSFLDRKTTADDFTAICGQQMLQQDDAGSPLAGVLQSARELDWEIVPAAHFQAMPSGIVEDEVVELFWAHFRTAAASAGPLDGICLVLHGAMVSESLADVEGELLSRIRCLSATAGIPVGGVVDLHANFSETMARHSHGLVAYRTNPHTDAYTSAQRAARTLDTIMNSGAPAKTVWQHAGILWPPTGTDTSRGPMERLEAAAREAEAEFPDLLTVNVLAGFAFSDTPDTGVSFTAVVKEGAEELARREIGNLCALAGELREQGLVSDMPVSEAIAGVMSCQHGPVLLVEPSDNIGGGASGDGTALLHELVRTGIGPAVCVICDPECVQQVHSMPPVTRVELSIGGKRNRLGGPPACLDVELEYVSDGRFDLEDASSHLASMFGRHIDMGPCAVVRHGGIRILLTSRATPPFDLGQLRSQGIEPEKQRVIVVKAAVAHRRAYDPITKASYTVDTPGPCSSNLKRLPYQHLRRPIYPLDVT